MKKANLLILAVITILVASCKTQKTPLPYFTDISDTEIGQLDTMSYVPVIMPDDELSISVNSTNPNATAAFQMYFTNPAVSGELAKASSPRIQTYLVDSNGDIVFPILGNIHVAGMTCEQLKSFLTQRIEETVKDPIVDVRLLNFTVSVAGEVKNPIIIPITRQRMTILDALAAAGDLTEFGNRSNVLLVREENGKRTYVHLDLNDSKTLTSPYFYLKQNDYIYVSPNPIKESNSRYNQFNAYKLSVISTVVSASSVVASLIIALAIK